LSICSEIRIGAAYQIDFRGRNRDALDAAKALLAPGEGRDFSGVRSGIGSSPTVAGPLTRA